MKITNGTPTVQMALRIPLQLGLKVNIKPEGSWRFGNGQLERHFLTAAGVKIGSNQEAKEAISKLLVSGIFSDGFSVLVMPAAPATEQQNERAIITAKCLTYFIKPNELFGQAVEQIGQILIGEKDAIQQGFRDRNFEKVILLDPTRTLAVPRPSLAEPVAPLSKAELGEWVGRLNNKAKRLVPRPFVLKIEGERVEVDYYYRNERKIILPTAAREELTKMEAKLDERLKEPQQYTFLRLVKIISAILLAGNAPIYIDPKGRNFEDKTIEVMIENGQDVEPQTMTIQEFKKKLDELSDKIAPDMMRAINAELTLLLETLRLTV